MIGSTRVGDSVAAAGWTRGLERYRMPLRAAAMAALAGVAVWLGITIPESGLPRELAMAAGILGVLILGALAWQRFEWFIWVVLLVRPLVDLTKAEGSSTTGSGPVATVIGGAVILAGLVWLAAQSREGRRRRLGLVSRALVLLMLSSFLSVGHSVDPVMSLLQVARTLGAVVVLLVLEQLLRTRAMARRALVICGVAALGPLIAGAVQLLSGGTGGDGPQRLVGSFTHPNTFGFFLVLLILMGYALRPHVGRGARRAIDLLLVVALVELVFTYSRGGWLVLGLGLLVIGLVADRRLFIVIPTAAAAVWFLVPSVRDRLADLDQAETVTGRPGNSASWRAAHIEELLANRQAESIFGAGPGMSERLSEYGRLPHNDAVRLFVENGIVGLACYLSFLLALAMLATRGLRRLRAGFGRGLAVGFAACTVAFVADSMGANLITNFVILVYVLALAAVVQAWLSPDADPDGPEGPELGSSTPANLPSAAGFPAEERPTHGAP